MTFRGGTVKEHFDAAGRLIERLPVLLMAEKDGVAVGWCGIQKHSIFPDGEPVWLVVGLTVFPDQRRRGIAVRPLHAVHRVIAGLTSVASIGSVRAPVMHGDCAVVERFRGDQLEPSRAG